MFVLESLRRSFMNPLLLRVARYVGSLLTILSIGLILRQAIAEINNGDREIFFFGMAISFLAYGISFVLQGIVWCLLIVSLSGVKSGWRDLGIFAYSNLMRRTPGIVWYLLERTERYRESGVSARITLATSGVEFIILIIAAIAMYSITCLKQIADWLPLLGAVVFFICLLSTPIILKRWNSLPDRSTIYGMELRLLNRLKTCWLEISFVFLLDCACYVLGGCIVYALVLFVSPINQLTFYQAVELWTFAGGIGLLGSIIIPVNLGLRDFTLAAMLWPIMSPTDAITVAAIVRLVFSIADVTLSITLWQLSKLILSRRETNRVQT